MNRVILSAILMAAAICYSVFSAVFSASEAVEIRRLTKQIDELNTIYIMSGDIVTETQAIALAEKLEHLAETYENKVSLFVRDERLSSLEYSAARIKHLIRYGSDEVSAELENIREQVETISESERPYWYNIL
jgi:hypothetical protein